MNPEDFQENISGHLISIPEGGLAYVPNPLPPMNLTWDSGLIEFHGLLTGCDLLQVNHTVKVEDRPALKGIL